MATKQLALYSVCCLWTHRPNSGFSNSTEPVNYCVVQYIWVGLIVNFWVITQHKVCVKVARKNRKTLTYLCNRCTMQEISGAVTSIFCTKALSPQKRWMLVQYAAADRSDVNLGRLTVLMWWRCGMHSAANQFVSLWAASLLHQALCTALVISEPNPPVRLSKERRS